MITVCAMLVCTSSASASRTQTPYTVAGGTSQSFDSKGDLWVTVDGNELVNGEVIGPLLKYDSYPSQTLLAEPDTLIPFEYGYFLVLQGAFDQATNEAFVTQSNGSTLAIFAGSDGHYLRQWTGLTNGPLNVAVDNSNTYSRGRVYLSLLTPQNAVAALDAAERPVEFPATANYIDGNKLTGTPQGRFGGVSSIAVDEDNGDLLVYDAGRGVVDEFDSSGTFLRSLPGGVPAADPTNGDILIGNGSEISEYDASGNLLETISDGGAPAVNSQGYLYSTSGSVYTPNQPLATIAYEPVTEPTTTSATLNATVSPNGSGNITSCQFEYGTESSYGTTTPCNPDPNASPPGSNFTSPTMVSAAISGLSPETTYHYRVVVVSANGTKYGTDRTYTTGKVPGLSTDSATNLSEDSATLNASFVGDGSDTHYYFEWGPTNAYGNTTAAPPGQDAGSPTGPSHTSISATLTGLEPYSTYHYRVVATNGSGTSQGQDQYFTTTPGSPTVKGAAATEVHADRALLHGEVDPNGTETTVDFEYVDDATFQQSGWANAATTSPSVPVGMGKQYVGASSQLTGLTPDTLYHYRAVGNNEMGQASEAGTFRTFAFTPSFSDPCPNAHVRQQTGSALLLDCRAYELVSASNAGGYDVESNLVPGQMPFGGYPDAEGRVLYGVHDGGIPGTGHPTDNGVDPYVATRTENGWTTKYVGIPANDQYATGPFSSTLLEADASLQTFAFGGPEICSPCFGDGSTGIPIHLPDGELVQGEAGSISEPKAEPAGFIGKHLSADGTHFIFGSKAKLEEGANTNGDVNVYDRDLATRETHLVSKTPSGQTMGGSGIGELDVSGDGSRIVLGQLLSEEGNYRYWHLYMNIGDSGKTIDLTPGTTHGVLFDGMTEDGSKVFFSTVDHLTDQEAAHSGADIFEAEVSEAGTATLHLISKGQEETSGAPGDTASCDPAANTKHEHWNTTGSEENCGVVAVGGGGGVASGDGTIYFLSPEKLDGSSNGVQNAPNLYVSRPGQPPHFVATLESSANAPLPTPVHPFLRSFGSFANPAGVAIDHATGDIYVFDIGTDEGTAYVYKFDPQGHSVTSFGVGGKLTVAGSLGAYDIPLGIAVDNDPSSPNYGDLYVPELLGSVVKQFSPEGVHLGDIGVSLPTAVGVDPSNGNVYVTGYYGGIQVFDTSGNLVTEFPTASGVTDVAVDSLGNSYVTNGGGISGNEEGVTEKYGPTGTDLGTLDSNSSYAVAVDPSNDHVYVDEGDQVVEYDASGAPTGTPIGSGLLSGSIGIAADSGELAIANHAQVNVAVYGAPVLPPDSSTDNPLVVDSVTDPGARMSGDFQVTPSGADGVFTSTLALTEYDNSAHREVYRYDSPTGRLTCASCSPTGETATGEASLASEGLSLTDDGRVFFNSTEGLVDRDLNGNKDVYEWEPNGFRFEYEVDGEHKSIECETTAGCLQLISTGASPLDSALLGVSADGTDAYFFTHEPIVASDDNGTRVKLYDARENGGFPQAPPPHQCQASDECHGPGTPAPEPPSIRSVTGSGGNTSKAKKKGKGTHPSRHHPRRRHHHRHRHSSRSHSHG